MPHCSCPSLTADCCLRHACSAVTVQFDSDFGDLPIMTADSSALTSTTFTLAEGRAGTKEDVECSGNGVCGELAPP